MSSSQIVDRDLTENDIKTLLNTLIFDDKIEMIKPLDGPPYYTLSSNDRAFEKGILTE